MDALGKFGGHVLKKSKKLELLLAVASSNSYASFVLFKLPACIHNSIYYMEKSVLLGTKPLVDSIRHFIRDPSGVLSVWHLCECRIVQWRHDSRLLLLLNWFLHVIKRTLHVGSKIWILCSSGKSKWKLFFFLPLKKIHIRLTLRIIYDNVCCLVSCSFVLVDFADAIAFWFVRSHVLCCSVSFITT